jgi:hypothetical protein
MKRGIINLGGASPKFRISKSGFSADSANINDFLFHESFLYQRIIAAGVLANPGAGASFTATVPLGVSGVLNSNIEFSIYSGGIPYSQSYFIYTGALTILVDNIVWSITSGLMTVNFGSAKNSSLSYVVYKV